MCLAVLALNAHPRLPLLLVANRDEYHARPSLPAGPWPGHPDIVAGRDLSAGGTWLGIARGGRYALVTNYRDPRRLMPDAPSRGALVQDYLQGALGPEPYLRELAARQQRYNGFNLIVGDPQGAWYAGNRDPQGGPRRLADGVHGLSNHLLDTPWPKVRRTRQAVAALLREPHAPAVQALMEVFADRRGAPDGELPDTGVGLARERMLASPFIASPDYGTRCTTVVLAGPDGAISLYERQYDPQGAAVHEAGWRLRKGPAHRISATDGSVCLP
ncbi:NRDE family protein [Orrella sp. JC864]|uniref:NRDE family protein n=1 Tax=Orrella sp. JC864 TaxID=3120298 RepID=UPI003009C3D1